MIGLFGSLDIGVNTKTRKHKTMHKYMIFVDTCVIIKKIVNEKILSPQNLKKKNLIG